MPGQSDINERRINVFVSPEAKRMLRELGERYYPNLKRPDGAVVELLIREAYGSPEVPRLGAPRIPFSTDEVYDPRAREQQVRQRTQIEPRDPQGPRGRQ
jgi:hypothetical protein